MEVHVGEREDLASDMITRFLEVGLRTVDHFLKGPADMEFDDRVHILLDLGSRGAGLDKDIGIIITT
jgi:hypothetical protein